MDHLQVLVWSEGKAKLRYRNFYPTLVLLTSRGGCTVYMSNDLIEADDKRVVDQECFWVIYSFIRVDVKCLVYRS